jgi:glutathione S-transferase
MLIYQLPISLYCFKLRLALRLKGVEIGMMVPPGGSYRSPEYAAINPAGTIPALVDGAFWLAESDAIIEYLDDLDLGAPLRSPDLRLRARDRMLSRWCDMRLEPAVRRLFPQINPSRRDPAAVPDVDATIGAALAVMEKGLDADGPFACGPAPGLTDCGLTATLVWLEALTVTLALNARPGPRLLRSLRALSEDLRTRDEVSAYRALAMVV